MSWLLLFLAGLLEVVWVVGLKFSAGFTKPLPSVVTVAAMVASFYLLSLAMRTLPLGTAYAIWVGIGAVGASMAGIVLFAESFSLMKALSLLLIIIGMAGLKLSS